MKPAVAFSRSGSAEAVIELVAGTQDGLRELVTREADGKPAKCQVRDVETYVRRGEPERCQVDGLLVWHCDVDRS